MSKIFIFLSHTLTQEQMCAIKDELNVVDIINLPDELQLLWGNIPPEPERIYDILQPFHIWLKANSQYGDYVLVQGDMGATFQIVNYAFSIGLKPCYTTTKRNTIQEYNNDGTVNLIKQFKHVRFRLYEKEV